MVEPLADRVMQSISQAAGMYYRLIILVAPADSGKTEVLHKIHESTMAPLININLELSLRMLELTERQRVLQLPRILSDIVGASADEVILLDNIELLFDVSLKQDPLRLLQGLSRNKTLVVSWGGIIDGGNMIYASPGHPEYKRYPIRDILVLSSQDIA
jgi:signal recognition particle receptor subunit beta